MDPFSYTRSKIILSKELCGIPGCTASDQLLICTSSDQLLNFFTLVAEVAVQHKSANFAIFIDGDNLLTDNHLNQLLGEFVGPLQQLIGRRPSNQPKFSN